MKAKLSAFLLSALILVSCGSPAVDESASTESTDVVTSEATSEDTSSETEDTATDGSVVVIDGSGEEIVLGDSYAETFIIFPNEALSMLSITQDLDRYLGMNGAENARVSDSVLANHYPGMLDINTSIAPEAGSFEPSVEEIIKVAPDVVYQWNMGGEERWEPLEAVGIPVVKVNWGEWVDDQERYALYAEAIGESARMEELVANQQAAIDHISGITGPIEDKQNHIYLTAIEGNEIAGWGRELPFTAIHGVENAPYIYDGIDTTDVSANTESLLAWNPDMIIISEYAVDEGVFDPATVMSDPTLQSLDAVKNKRVYVAPNAPQLDNPNTIWYFYAMLGYPELFEDVDIREIIREDHQFLYNVELTDEEIDQVLNVKYNSESANFEGFMSNG